MTLLRYFATCARGLEPVLADELRDLAALQVEPGRGGVAFAGDLSVLYKANLWLRTAVRVLRPVFVGPVDSADELYQAVQSVEWSQFMTPDHTLAVDCNVRDSAITHSQFAARRVKDAICDQFIARCGRRPSVDTENPMIPLNLHVFRNVATLSLDASGESLHKRGYRPILTRAPLNEALAVGLLQLGGWLIDEPLIDPMCGSGTFCIEGAWLALKRPPGLTRKRFGFHGWLDFDITLWSQLRDEARQNMLKALPAPIMGFDVRRDAIEHSRNNAKAAGVGNLLSFERSDLSSFTPPVGKPGTIICNPPYGERLGEEVELRPLYEAIGAMFGRCPGWNCLVFSGNEGLASRIGLSATRRWAMFNGRLPCQLLRFEPT